MAGQFRVSSDLPGPEPTKTTRLQLVNDAESITAQLSAMTLDYGDFSLYTSKLAKLGQDPLRSDADVATLWAMLAKKKATVPIGEFLMDQWATYTVPKFSSRLGYTPRAAVHAGVQSSF
jgi:formamidopyrimidine-DNA glycosylase